MTRELSLQPRLALLASLVPQGAVLADVGTDHGYIPVCLRRRGEGSLRAQVRSSRLLQRLLRQDEGAGLSHCFDFSESDRLRTVAFLRSVPVIRVRIERMRHVCIFSY